ncbi:MAG: AAA family ATPase [Candidatus Woesebacteria bacterium]|jgi:DNA repair protein RadA/Sms
MPKSSTFFTCQNCAATYAKWQGQCSDCGQWNTLVEELRNPVLAKSKGAAKASKLKKADLDKLTVSFPEVKLVSESKQRFSTSIGELDRVLGGGLVPGAVTLIGGEPGIGKSTLLTQMILGMLNEKKLLAQEKGQNLKQDSIVNAKKIAISKPEAILYICGEESPSQIHLRISRILDNEQFFLKNSLAKKSKKQLKTAFEQLLFVTSTNVDELVQIIAQKKPQLVIVDSIQTLKTEDLSGASGSIGQIRESSERIIDIVKNMDIATFLVGHVTKDGAIAGPKILEHMVDAVLELSGESSGQFRMLRALKNRFGATDEVGVFKFSDYGLEEVSNPSELFLESQDQTIPGTATVCIIEGTRPLLIEVQALVLKSQLAMPRRVGRGIELSRIQVLTAVLQKHCRLPLGSTDVFLSAAGGFRIKEPAVDLGLAVAIASSLKNKKLPSKSIFIGEVGLLGEIRTVSRLEKRIKEAKRLGFKKIISRKTHQKVSEVLRNLGI